MHLSDAEVTNLIAYIRSLETSRTSRN